MTKLIEKFHSLQGEGPRAGTPSYFFRFGGCNLKCDFCDTKYSWDERSGDDLMLVGCEIEPMSDVVITGGEPFLHYIRTDFLEFYLTLIECRANVYFESNGFYDVLSNLNMGNVLVTLDEVSRVILDHYTNSAISRGSFNKINFVISPKLDTSCYYEAVDIDDIVKYFLFDFRDLKNKYYNLHYKFVFDSGLKGGIVSIISGLNEIFVRENIYIMPKTPIMNNMIIKDEMRHNMELAADFCKEYGVKYSPRLQVDIWGNKKGM